ncbi:MAG: hypothetical protein C0483_23685 [Pirellula sp.]|nr:hypothetical protein [Pirellula sp.]
MQEVIGSSPLSSTRKPVQVKPEQAFFVGACVLLSRRRGTLHSHLAGWLSPMPPPIKVDLQPHSAQWALDAEREASRLSAALGSSLFAVHHIGSTAIPGIRAKPILDLLPEVRDLGAFDDATTALRALGYQWWGEYGIVGRRYLTLDDAATGKRRCQLHCFQVGNFEIERHLAFRDYLRSHPKAAQAYDAEKARCRDLYPDDSHAYSDAKSPWIAAQLEIALDHRRKVERMRPT